MRQSVQGVQVAEEVDLDWGLILAAERFATGADIHDCRALLCAYRDACEILHEKPKNKYYLARRDVAIDLLRSLLSGRRTVVQATAAKREWWIKTGKKLFEEEHLNVVR